MQIGGVGGGADSHSSSHQVTGCIHQHETVKKEVGAMRVSSGHALSDTDQVAEMAKKEFAEMSVFREIVITGKRLLGRFRGSNGTGSGMAADGSGGERADSLKEQVMAQIAEAESAERAGLAGQGRQDRNPGQSAGQDAAAMLHTPRVAAAATAVQPPQTALQNNPYFTTTSDTGLVRENVFQKIRIKFRDAAGKLTKRFFGRFSNTSSGQSALNSGRRQPKEDLRKHSRYREDGLEINCILTDDSYLMDSYDRRGEYSRLTTENKK